MYDHLREVWRELTAPGAPFEVREVAAKNGLRGRIYHSFRRFPLNLFNRIQLRPLNRFLFNVRSAFVLAGERAD